MGRRPGKPCWDALSFGCGTMAVRDEGHHENAVDVRGITRPCLDKAVAAFGGDRKDAKKSDSDSRGILISWRREADGCVCRELGDGD